MVLKHKLIDKPQVDCELVVAMTNNKSKYIEIRSPRESIQLQTLIMNALRNILGSNINTHVLI